MGSGSSTNISKDISANQFNNAFNDFNNEQNNNDAADIIHSGSFQERFKSKYSIGELNNFLKNFIKEEKIQDVFFSKSEPDDPALMILKNKELQDLTNFFRSNQSNMIDSLETKIINLLNEKINFNNITKNIFQMRKRWRYYMPIQK